MQEDSAAGECGAGCADVECMRVGVGAVGAVGAESLLSGDDDGDGFLCAFVSGPGASIRGAEIVAGAEQLGVRLHESETLAAVSGESVAGDSSDVDVGGCDGAVR